MNPHSANIIVFWTIESILGWPTAYAEAYYEHKICFVSCRLRGYRKGPRSAAITWMHRRELFRFNIRDDRLAGLPVWEVVPGGSSLMILI